MKLITATKLVALINERMTADYQQERRHDALYRIAHGTTWVHMPAAMAQTATYELTEHTLDGQPLYEVPADVEIDADEWALIVD